MLRWLNVAAFCGLALVNILANALPIAGVKTEDISAKYQNLLSPADYTFMIWGVIYFLLAAFVIYQASKKQETLTQKCGWWFVFSCILNGVWMILWHYDRIGLSVICMALLLLSLIVLSFRLRDVRSNVPERLIVQGGFGLYFGWVTVAMVLNVTSLLVKMAWNAFGLSPQVWAAAVLVLVAVLTLYVLRRYRNIAYALAVIWGYIGIVVQHLKVYQGQYGWVIAAGVVAALFLLWPMYRVASGKEKVGALE